MIEKNGYVVVEKGDTLGAIADKIDVSIDELQSINGKSLKDPDKINVGQKIKTNKPLKKEIIEEEVEVKEERSSSDMGEEAVKSTKEESSNNSEATNCCCIITNWKIIENGRRYELEIVKDEKLIKQKDSNDRELKGHTLNIMTSPVDKDGKVTYKEITTSHEFKRNTCELIMIAEQGKYDVALKEGAVLKINSHGSIVDEDGKAVDEYIKPTPMLGCSLYDIPTPKEKRIKAYNLRSIPYERLQKKSNSYLYPDNNENSTLPMNELECYPIFEDLPNNLESWDFTKIFKLMFKPIELAENISIFPSGSKCPKDKKVLINVTKPIKIKGAATLTFGKESLTDKRAGLGSGGNREINNASTAAALALEITHGTHLYAFSMGGTLGGGSRDIRTKNLTKYDSGKLFKGGAKLITKIYDMTAALNKNRFVGYKSPFSFNPGVTKFEISGADLTLVELPDEHTLAWDGKIAFGITLFDRAEGKLDLIPYISLLGNAFTTLLETVFNIKKEKEDKRKTNPNDKNLLTGTLELYLTLEASLGGELSLELKSAEKNIVSTSTLGAKVVLKAIGRVEGGINAFKIEAKAGAVITLASANSIGDGVGIKGEIKLTQKKQGANPSFEGDIICTGAGLYYACYTEMVYKDDLATANKSVKGKNEKVIKAKHETKDKELKADGKTEDKIVFLEEFSIVDTLFKGIKKEIKNET